MKNGRILVIGSSNTDMTVKVKRLPLPGETVLGTSFTMGAGGKGANQAVAVKRLGGEVQFICKVGNDIFGDNSVRHYAGEGLDTDKILRSNLPSGVALIPVDDQAENSIVVASGANMDFSPADIAACRAEIEACDILLMQLEIPVPAVLEAARIAHAAGKYVILNPAPAADLPEELFGLLSLFIPNETELSRFSGRDVRDEASAEQAARALQAKGVKDLIVTLGSKGSLVVPQGAPAVRVEAVRVEAVDTTGAGDTFCGALCVALSEGKTLAEAARFAACAAALQVIRLGAQESIPTRAEMDRFAAQL